MPEPPRTPDPRPPAGARRATPVTLAALAAVAVACLVATLATTPGDAAARFGAAPTPTFGGEPWRLLTSAFVCASPWALLFVGFGLWIFGRAVELRLGSPRAAVVLLSSQVGGTAAAALAALLLESDRPIGGADPAVLGIVAATGVLLAREPLRLFGAFTLSGRGLATLVVALAAAAPLFYGHLVPLAGVLGGSLVGLVSARLLSPSAARRPGVPRGTLLERLRRWRLRRRYRVISGGRDHGRGQAGLRPT